jgi:hypothetical protein
MSGLAFFDTNGMSTSGGALLAGVPVVNPFL